MPLVDYDAHPLAELIAQKSLEGAWKALLARHVIDQGERFSYLLDTEFLGGAEPTEENLIEGLSFAEVGALYEFSLSQNYEDKRSKGQFYTPQDIASILAEYSHDFPPGIWLDPCCGVGNLAYALIASQENPEEFFATSMICSDMDPLALEIAHVLLTLAFQYERDNLYGDTADRFVTYDYLEDAPSTTPPSGLPAHDYVLMNPPYVSHVRDARFRTDACGDTYAYFLEKALGYARGIISITPQSFTYAKQFLSLRTLLLERCSSLAFCALDNMPDRAFSGVKFGSKNTNLANSTRPALMVAHCHHEDPSEPLGKITTSALLRWVRSERAKALSRLEEQKAHDIPVTSEFFPRVSPELAPLYMSLPEGKVKDLLSKKPTDFPLYVPSSPRYFIPALSAPVQRGSLKVIYAQDEDAWERVYLLLNSTFFYWWWCVRDGGMLLSQETINSCPLPEFPVDQELIARLRTSEVENKVYASNAGKIQENVKHPLDLITALDTLIRPDYIPELHRTRSNSFLASERERMKS